MQTICDIACMVERNPTFDVEKLSFLQTEIFEEIIISKPLMDIKSL